MREVTVWNEGVFRLSRHNLESIQDALEEADFAVFVFTPDDVTVLRGDEKPSVRDNVILELGIAIGRLGRLRTFIVQPRDVDYHLPTDLLGITVATYDPDRQRDFQAALGMASDQIRRELESDRPEFPKEGSFGPNILSPEVESLQPDRDYSLTFDAPYGKNVEVELVNETAGESERVPWAMRLGPERRIDHSTASEGKQLFWNTEPGTAETPIRFHDHGAVKIAVHVDGELSVQKRVTW